LFKLGSRIEIRSAMIPITTSNSTNVNPFRFRMTQIPRPVNALTE
jgi:hypothetical protein